MLVSWSVPENTLSIKMGVHKNTYNNYKFWSLVKTNTMKLPCKFSKRKLCE